MSPGCRSCRGNTRLNNGFFEAMEALVLKRGEHQHSAWPSTQHLPPTQSAVVWIASLGSTGVPPPQGSTRNAAKPTKGQRQCHGGPQLPSPGQTTNSSLFAPRAPQSGRRAAWGPQRVALPLPLVDCEAWNSLLRHQAQPAPGRLSVQTQNQGAMTAFKEAEGAL